MLFVDGRKLDDYAVEAFVELRNDQPLKDRFKYLDVAIEGIVNPQTRVKMIQRLYEDLIAHADIDFGCIPETKGDFTKYRHYKIITNTIESFSKLNCKNNVSEIELCEKLFNMLIACRSDFEYGYKFEVELIKVSYGTLVIALHRMIDIAIMRTVEVAKQLGGFNFQVAHSKCNDLLVYQSVKGIVKSYEKGEWTEMINSFKKGRSNFMGPFGAALKSAGLITGAGAATALTATGTVAFAIVSMLVIVLCIRKLVYLFYSSAYKINDSINRYKGFLEYAMNSETNESAKLKQKSCLDKMNRIHDIIETKIFAENDKAKKKLSKVNKERFTIADIGPDNVDQVMTKNKENLDAKIVDHSLDEPEAPIQQTVSPTPVSNEVSETTSAGNFSIF